MREYVCAPDQDVVISSRVRLSRNYEDLPFSPKLTPEYANEVIDRTAKSVFSSKHGASFMLLRMNDLENDARNRLVEHHLISYDLLKYANRSAAMVSSAGTVSVMLNEEDHIRLQVMKPGLALADAYDTADKLDTAINDKLRFAFDEHLGYLTECPTNLGTGMRASVMLHLPALTALNRVGTLAATVSKLGLTIRGAYGEGSAPLGDLYQISNQVTLGISEKSAIENLKTIVLQLAAQERAARTELLKTVETEDMIYRAYGVLKSARLLNTKEFMQLASQVRMGAVGGVLQVDANSINDLMFTLQPAGINTLAGKTLDAHERDIERAKIVRERL